MLTNKQITAYKSYRYNHIWTTNQGAQYLRECYHINIPIHKDKQQRKEKKNKRPRTIFTTAQRNILEEYFSRHCYIKPKDRYELSKLIGIGEKQIKVWFQNKRMKIKKKSSDESYSDMPDWSPNLTSPEKSGIFCCHSLSPGLGLIQSANPQSNYDEILNDLLSFNQGPNLYCGAPMPENGYVPQNWDFNYQYRQFPYEMNTDYSTEYYPNYNIPNNLYMEQNHSHNLDESNVINDCNEVPLSYQQY